MQLYLKKPEGMKPLYSRELVDLALRVHIPPRNLYEAMFFLRQSQQPSIKHLWDVYGKNERKLKRDVERLFSMDGFSNASLFYDGVGTADDDFENMFKPIADGEVLTPVMLIMILNLYFRLTPITMVKDTPEIQDLAKLLKLKPELIVEIMEIFQLCDPYLNKDMMIVDDLLHPCQQIWKRYGNDNPQKLAAYAAQLKEFFK
jgi:hypothetical protein